MFVLIITTTTLLHWKFGPLAWDMPVTNVTAIPSIVFESQCNAIADEIKKDLASITKTRCIYVHTR